jgi:hypothetical protein
VKGRLRQASLSTVEFSFAGEHSIAQNGLGCTQATRLYEIPIVGNENVPDEVGMIRLEELAFAHTDKAHINASSARAGDVVQGIAAHA